MDAPKRTILCAKRLRRALTPPELRLWLALRQRPDGLKFRRQHPTGPYVLDFYCDAAKLAVEVDGAVHDIAAVALADRQREAWLAERGLAVIRFPASAVLTHRDNVVDAICRTARARLSPRPLGEGDHATAWWSGPPA